MRMLAGARTALQTKRASRSQLSQVLKTAASVAAAWQQKFLREFGGNGGIAVPGDSTDRSSVAFAERARVPVVWTQDPWADGLFAASGKLKQGTAGGPDLLPPELFRAETWPCARILAGLAEVAFANGVPTSW